MMTLSADIDTLNHYITDEVLKALSLDPQGWLRGLIAPLVSKATRRFSEIGAAFDGDLVERGIQQAAIRRLPYFGVKTMEVSGENAIPQEGPLLVVSNHPGTVDSLLILSNLPRNDIKIVTGSIPFLRALPASANHFIQTTLDPHVRMTTLRECIRHLKQQGALLIFGSGGIDPDPSFMFGAEQAIQDWSRSVELLIRKIPETRVIVSILSGVLRKEFAQNILTRLRKHRRDRQRIAEFLQMIRIIISPNKFFLSPKVTFTPPIEGREIGAESDPSRIMQVITGHGLELLKLHTASSPLFQR